MADKTGTITLRQEGTDKTIRITVVKEECSKDFIFNAADYNTKQQLEEGNNTLVVGCPYNTTSIYVTSKLGEQLQDFSYRVEGDFIQVSKSSDVLEVNITEKNKEGKVIITQNESGKVITINIIKEGCPFRIKNDEISFTHLNHIGGGHIDTESAKILVESLDEDSNYLPYTIDNVIFENNGTTYYDTEDNNSVWRFSSGRVEEGGFSIDVQKNVSDTHGTIQNLPTYVDLVLTQTKTGETINKRVNITYNY